MANLSFPKDQASLGKCPHCGAEIKIDPIWYTALQRLFALVNASL